MISFLELRKMLMLQSIEEGENMDFKVINGFRPILLSASHSARHLRPGFDSKRPKLNKPYTELIVEILCEKGSCFGIYTTKLQKLDPNWYKDSSYKKEIKNLVEKMIFNLFWIFMVQEKIDPF